MNRSHALVHELETNVIGVKRLFGVLLLSVPQQDGEGNWINDPDSDMLRLYLKPDLVEWLEFPRDDHITSEKEGENAGINAIDVERIDRTTVWVNGNANIEYHGYGLYQFNAQLLGGPIADLLRQQRLRADDASITDFATLEEGDSAGTLPTTSWSRPC